MTTFEHCVCKSMRFSSTPLYKLALSCFFLYSQSSDLFGTCLLTPTVLKWSRISSVYYVGTKDGSVYVVDIPENGKQAKPEKLLADRYNYIILHKYKHWCVVYINLSRYTYYKFLDLLRFLEQCLIVLFLN